MQKQKQSQVLVTIVSYFCSSSSILPHQIHCTFFMFFFHTSILLFSIAILRQKIFLVWWYIFSIKWQIILLLTMRFISIICPIKKRSERVSFQKAMIQIFSKHPKGNFAFIWFGWTSLKSAILANKSSFWGHFWRRKM